MSAAAPAAPAAPAKSKKKLIIIIAAAVLVLALGGGAAVYMMKKKAAEAAAAAEAAEAGDDDGAADKHKGGAKEHGAKAHDEHNPPTFLPMDAFVVNLADRDTDRFAQIGITFEVDDAKFAEQMKLYMPAIRNGILMILAHKTSAQLLERAGKEALAKEIMREAVRPLGIELEEEEDDEDSAHAKPADEDAPKSKKKKKKKKAPTVHNPVRSVNFSNFIIQ